MEEQAFIYLLTEPNRSCMRDKSWIVYRGRVERVFTAFGGFKYFGRFRGDLEAISKRFRGDSEGIFN